MATPWTFEKIDNIRRHAYHWHTSELVVSFMDFVFSLKPYLWQVEVIYYLCMMSIKDISVPLTHILLVWPTGGELPVHDVYAIINESPGTDQEEKIHARVKQTNGPVIPIHLDKAIYVA
jgi:hypothetical protein